MKSSRSIQLVKACKDENLNLVKKLLQCDINVNAKDNSGWTALHYAAGWRLFNIAEVLLKNGADPNIKNPQRKTALDMVFGLYELKEVEFTLQIMSQGLHLDSGEEAANMEFKEPTCSVSEKENKETLRLFKLIYKPQKSLFDAERVLSYCKKFGIPQIADILVKDGYNIDKIRKQSELDERIEGKNNRLREKRLQKILSQQGYIMKQIGKANPTHRFKYLILDKKTKGWAREIDPRGEGITLDRIEKIFRVNHKEKQ